MVFSWFYSVLFLCICVLWDGTVNVYVSDLITWKSCVSNVIFSTGEMIFFKYWFHFNLISF